MIVLEILDPLKGLLFVIRPSLGVTMISFGVKIILSANRVQNTRSIIWNPFNKKRKTD